MGIAIDMVGRPLPIATAASDVGGRRPAVPRIRRMGRRRLEQDVGITFTEGPHATTTRSGEPCCLGLAAAARGPPRRRPGRRGRAQAR